jgi:preprotein translocase subunit YajC
VGIALLFWLLMIRPAQRRQRAQRQMQSSLSVGDEVVLTSGIYGLVRSLDDDRIDVEIAPGTVIAVARGAVGTVVTKGELSESSERSDSIDTDPADDDAETTEER